MKDIPKDTHVSRKMGGSIFVRTISLLICKWDAILEDDDNNKKLSKSYDPSFMLSAGAVASI